MAKTLDVILNIYIPLGIYHYMGDISYMGEYIFGASQGPKFLTLLHHAKI